MGAKARAHLLNLQGTQAKAKKAPARDAGRLIPYKVPTAIPIKPTFFES